MAFAIAGFLSNRKTQLLSPIFLPPLFQNLNSLISTYEVFIRIVVSDLLVATLLV